VIEMNLIEKKLKERGHSNPESGLTKINVIQSEIDAQSIKVDKEAQRIVEQAIRKDFQDARGSLGWKLTRIAWNEIEDGFYGSKRFEVPAYGVGTDSKTGERIVFRMNSKWDGEYNDITEYNFEIVGYEAESVAYLEDPDSR